MQNCEPFVLSCKVCLLPKNLDDAERMETGRISDMKVYQIHSHVQKNLDALCLFSFRTGVRSFPGTNMSSRSFRKILSSR